MAADSLVVLALMVGFLSMVTVGVWSCLEDDTRDALHRIGGRLVIGLGAAVGLLLVAAG